MFFLSQLMKATSSASAVTDALAVTLPDNDESACSAPITEAVTPPKFKDMAVQCDIGRESLADVGKISQDHLLLLFFNFFFIVIFFFYQAHRWNLLGKMPKYNATSSLCL